LAERASALEGPDEDHKLARLTKTVKKLLDDGYDPIVFCRYIPTADYVAEHLDGKLGRKTEITAVTGTLSPAQRIERIERMAQAAEDNGFPRVLVATDCLSEGVNLQHWFNAVVHYDLSWNPTRHEQREGRVDRFGQKHDVVRATLIYGANNPVDGAVLEVILRKAAKIREELGVPVPLPDDGHTLSQALLKAVLLRKHEREERRQRTFAFVELEEAKAIETRWRDAAEKAKKN